MSDIVERVAEAIALSGNGGTWDDWYNEDQKEFHRKRARAAIHALREPTEAMIEAEPDGDGEWDKTNSAACAKAFWQAMVDAALAGS